MKIRTTKRAICSAYSNIICLQYCSLRALDYLNADYYNAGNYGWNYDCFGINEDTVIFTGYRPFGNIKPTYKTIESYNEKLVPLLDEYKETGNYERFVSKIQKLVKEFSSEVTNTDCPF